MSEFIEPFLEEARELVEQASEDLLALERTPGDRAHLDGAFRAFHTLKGSAGIVDFEAMARACHAVEDALAAARDGTGGIRREVVTNALACLGQVDRWLDAITETGEIPTDAASDADAIVRLFDAPPASPAAAAAPERSIGDGALGGDAPDRDTPGFPAVARAILVEQAALLAGTTTDGRAGRIAAAGRAATAVLRRSGMPHDETALVTAIETSLAADDPRPLATALAAILDGAPAADHAAASGPREAGATTLRVPVERVDALVQLTGELTVAKNALGHVADLARGGASAQQMAAALRERLAVMDRLVAELQRAVLATRVLPLRAVFQRFPRLVREIATALGKDVRLELAGEDTEADKAVVEALFEPLLHVLRNAVDHGVETPADRAAAGKSATATIRLRARHEAESVIVEVEDDGGGVDVAGVRAAAVRKGAATAAAVAAMSDREALTLIFAPGLSTAETVTDLSGRGVGMDAVRTAIERIGGAVSVESRPGDGTAVRFTLPFTVMMTAVMTVEAAGQAYGIPLEAVVETLRLSRDAIVPVGVARAFVLRDRTIPLVDLAAVLGTRPEAAPDGDATVLVAWADGRPVGFAVDRLGDRRDVMLKPMDGLLAGTPAVAGTTVADDGQILLVLDLAELLRETDG